MLLRIKRIRPEHFVKETLISHEPLRASLGHSEKIIQNATEKEEVHKEIMGG